MRFFRTDPLSFEHIIKFIPLIKHTCVRIIMIIDEFISHTVFIYACSNAKVLIAVIVIIHGKDKIIKIQRIIRASEFSHSVLCDQFRSVFQRYILNHRIAFHILYRIRCGTKIIQIIILFCISRLIFRTNLLSARPAF